MRYQAGIVLPGYNALKVANAPTIGTAINAGPTSVSVVFTAPSCVGGGAITSYTVFANCGVKLATGASSPITVTGLTTGTSYTFKAVATNAYGPSYPSAASNSVVPATLVTCATYTTAGTYTWIAPAGVTSVAAVAVGGGSGAGGGLGYKNNISVTPGTGYTVIVGVAGRYASSCAIYNGGTSSFVNTCTVRGGGAQHRTAGSYTGDGGGSGGSTSQNGGAGAGGYAGSGGTGGNPGASAGTGGAGGGAYGNNYGAGGVGIYGQGSNGAAGTAGSPFGKGGSGGCSGGYPGFGCCCQPYGGRGGDYGGGAGEATNATGQAAGKGAVRIVWCAFGARGTPSFPSTNVGP